MAAVRRWTVSTYPLQLPRANSAKTHWDVALSDSVVKLIDHAVLQPTQTDDDVRAACALCAELDTASVCVKPSHVPLAAACLRGSSVLVSTVIGFPHGGTTTETKVAETELACRQGAGDPHQ